MKYFFYWLLLTQFSFTLLLIRQRFFLFPLFFCFIFYFFKIEIVLSIPFRIPMKAAIKRYSGKYVCFPFDELYKIMYSFSNIRLYPGNLSTWSQRCC